MTTFIDCFCGCGGITLGFRNAGLKCLCGLDFFKDAIETFKYNFKDVPAICGDICDSEIKNKLYDVVKSQLDGKELDIVCGGFPCQGFSVAGERNKDDKRNKLYKELLEIVDHLKPKFVVCENVKGILSMDNGNVVKMIIDDFKNIGYEMEYKVLNSADYFTPEIRERVIFIGNRVGTENKFPEPYVKDKNNYIPVRDVLLPLMGKYKKYENHIPVKHGKDIIERMKKVKEGENLYESYNLAMRRLCLDKPSPTIMSCNGSNYIHPCLNRAITVREMAAIQSFPYDFVFKGSKKSQMTQVGNAVPPNLSKAIGYMLKTMNYYSSISF